MAVEPTEPADIPSENIEIPKPPMVRLLFIESRVHQVTSANFTFPNFE